jgi:hypothetical protein
VLAMQRQAGNAATAHFVAEHRRLVQRMNGKGNKGSAAASSAGGHKQGEHIFNALGNLALEMHGVMLRALASGAEPPAELNTLGTLANELISATNNSRFRTASAGSATNDRDYSAFTQDMRRVVPALLAGSSLAEFIEMNNLRARVDSSCVDAVAYASRKKDVPDPAAFEAWYVNTLRLMHATTRAIEDAAMATRERAPGPLAAAAGLAPASSSRR